MYVGSEITEIKETQNGQSTKHIGCYRNHTNHRKTIVRKSTENIRSERNSRNSTNTDQNVNQSTSVVTEIRRIKAESQRNGMDSVRYPGNSDQSPRYSSSSDRNPGKQPVTRVGRSMNPSGGY